jgi:hypothetical protein
MNQSGALGVRPAGTRLGRIRSPKRNPAASCWTMRLQRLACELRFANLLQEHRSRGSSD